MQIFQKQLLYKLQGVLFFSSFLNAMVGNKILTFFMEHFVIKCIDDYIVICLISLYIISRYVYTTSHINSWFLNRIWFFYIMFKFHHVYKLSIFHIIQVQRRCIYINTIMINKRYFNCCLFNCALKYVFKYVLYCILCIYLCYIVNELNILGTHKGNTSSYIFRCITNISLKYVIF